MTEAERTQKEYQKAMQQWYKGYAGGAQAKPKIAKEERMPGTPMLKQAGRMGIWIILSLFLAVFLFFLAFSTGGIFAILPWLMIILGILLAIGLGFKGKTGAAAIVLIIFVLFGAGALYMQTTSYGQHLALQVQVQGIGAIQGARAFAGPLNVMSQIFTGTYNPENLWRSDTVESQYQAVTNVGVTLKNVEPLRDKFNAIDANDKPVIRGRIDAVAFPGQTASVNLKATCSPALGSTELECSSKDWPCTPESFSNIKDIKNRYFSCASPTAQRAGVLSVDVRATAEGTWTVAGKQFVFANPDVAITLENPRETWGISTDSLKSWQKGDAFIDLGIGAAGVDEYGYLEAGSLNYYLGASIENPASNGDRTADFDSVQLFVPQALFGYNCSKAGAPDFGTCKNATTADLSKLGLKTTAPLCDCRTNIREPLAPGTPHVNRFLSITINKSQLYGADFGTFFVLAAAKYNYENSQLVAVQVEKITGPSGGVTT